MHVIELHAENFKRLTAVHITPAGALVEIAGKNGAGKSSVLDSIYAALGGAAAVPEKPIRKGQKKASVRVKLGNDKPELIVTRTFLERPDGTHTTSLTVQAVDGAQYMKPQQMLDELMGALSFDPLAFTRMKPREQLVELRRLVPGVDFTAIDEAHAVDFEERTRINRQVKALAAQLAAVSVPEVVGARIDEAALVAELEAAGEAKAEIERERARRAEQSRLVNAQRSYAEDCRNDARKHREKAAELRKEAERIDGLALSSLRMADTAESEAADRAKEVEALTPLKDAPATLDIRARIADAQIRNRSLDDRDRVIKRRDELAADLKRQEQRSEELTTAIEQRKADTAKAVAAANLPVPGLAFGTDSVLLNGLPFAQASHAEQLRASVAIAAAMNPKLRVVNVHDGSLLDEDGLVMLGQIAEQHGLQVWLEKVGTGETGILIEDGSVKATETEVAA